jgi:hypothetical protein
MYAASSAVRISRIAAPAKTEGSREVGVFAWKGADEDVKGVRRHSMCSFSYTYYAACSTLA